jgi:hypothetical protein
MRALCLTLCLCSAGLSTFSCREVNRLTAPDDRSPAAAQQEAGARASGRVDIENVAPFGNDNRYSFHARTKNGVTKGGFEYRQIRDPGLPTEAVVRLHGEVVCLRVAGNKATVGGRVDHSSFPEGIREGSFFEWSVTDNGEGHNDLPDEGSEFLGVLVPSCTVMWPQQQVVRANVQVRGGEPDAD